MRFGIWTPLPHTIRPEPVMDRAAAALQTRGGEGVDTSFQFAIDVLRKAERLGFATTLIAERFLGPDLEAWIMAAAHRGPYQHHRDHAGGASRHRHAAGGRQDGAPRSTASAAAAARSIW